MKLTAWYKSPAAWSAIVAGIAAIIAGIGYDKEAEMIGALAAIAIGYAASRGWVASSIAKSPVPMMGAGAEESKPGEINF